MLKAALFAISGLLLITASGRAEQESVAEVTDPL
jgi:hypothetical protein